MSTPSVVFRRFPPLDLRVFSTDTDRRFTLFIFAILSTSLYIFHTEIVTQFLGSALGSCANQSFLMPGSLDIDGLNYACSWLPDSQLTLGLLGGELLVLAVAILIYWLHPIWKCWREHLAPLKGSEIKNVKVEEIIDYLEKLRQKHIPSVRLRYVYYRDDLSFANPSVFSGLRSCYLFIPHGWVLLFDRDPEAFHNGILHEMAHFYNKDTGKTYFAKAILGSFVGIALLPFLLLLGWSLFNPGSNFTVDNIKFVLSEFWSVLPLAIIIQLIYNSILRSRELYADIQSTRWVDSSETFERILNNPTKGKRSSWRSVLKSHPNSYERTRCIRKPRRVFRLKFWEAFGIGITFAIAFPPIHDTFNMLTQLLSDTIFGRTYPLGYPDLGTLLLCLLAVPIIGQMIWRATLVSRIRGQTLRGSGRLGLCLAAGLIVGFMLSLYFAPFITYYTVHLPVILFYFAPWMFLLALGLFGFCRWLALFASLWMEVASTKMFPRIISNVGFIFAGLILAVGLTLFSLFLQMTLGYLIPGNANVTSLIHPILLQPVADTNFYWRLIIQAFFVQFLPRYYVFFAFAGLWALLLPSWFWYRWRMPRIPFQWAFADSIERQASTPPNPFHLRVVALITLIGSLIFCGLLLLIRLKPAEPATAIGSAGAAILVGPFLLPVLISPFLLAALFQVCIAVIIAIRTRPVGIINGLLGAFLGGFLMAISTLGIDFFFGGIGPDGIKIIFLFEVNWGTACTLGALPLLSVLQFKPHTKLKRRLLFFIPCILLIGAITLLPIIAKWVPGDQHPVATNIVKDGDFEDPIMLDTDAEYNAGQSFGNWTIASGSIILIATLLVPAHGAQSVDLNGSTTGIMYQDLSTRSGTSYSLSFAMAGDPACATPLVRQMQVWWGSTLVATLSFDTTGHHWSYPGWQYHTYPVYGAGTVTRLSFISLTPTTCGPTLDDVTVKE